MKKKPWRGLIPTTRRKIANHPTNQQPSTQALNAGATHRGTNPIMVTEALATAQLRRNVGVQW
jgi:hypothetical protein